MVLRSNLRILMCLFISYSFNTLNHVGSEPERLRPKSERYRLNSHVETVPCTGDIA